MKKYFILTIASLLIFINCSDDNKILNGGASISIDSQTLEIKDDYDEVLQNTRFITLESSPNSIVGSIDKLVMTEHNIFIGDFILGEIFVFSNSGNFLNKIKNENTLQIVDFAVDEEASLVIVGDNGQKKMSLFNIEGELLAETSTGFHFTNFAQIRTAQDELEYVFYIPQPKPGIAGINNESIIFTDSKFNIISKDFEKSSIQQAFNYSDNFRLIAYENKAYFNPKISGEVYELSSNGSELLYEVSNGIENLVQSLTPIINEGVSPLTAHRINTILPFNKFLINDTHWVFSTWLDNKPYNLMIDRSTNNKIMLRINYNITEQGLDFLPMTPTYSYKDNFISLFNPSTLNDVLSNLDANEHNNQSFEENENPVLVLQRFKTF